MLLDGVGLGGWVELGAPLYAQVSHSVVDLPSPKNKLQKPNVSCKFHVLRVAFRKLVIISVNQDRKR